MNLGLTQPKKVIHEIRIVQNYMRRQEPIPSTDVGLVYCFLLHFPILAKDGPIVNTRNHNS